MTIPAPITIKYTGKYPTLCYGKLTVIINDITWKFPENCLISGGTVTVTTAPWKIEDFPKDFPEELKVVVINAVNNTIPHGCCGGCI